MVFYNCILGDGILEDGILEDGILEDGILEWYLLSICILFTVNVFSLYKRNNFDKIIKKFKQKPQKYIYGGKIAHSHW